MMLDVPSPPDGMREGQLFRWAEILCNFLSTKNFQNVEPQAGTFVPRRPTPEPLITVSAHKSSTTLGLFSFRLVHPSTGAFVQERRWTWVFLLPDVFHPNVGTTVPNISARWDLFSVLITTYVARAAWLVLLRSTTPTTLSVRHSGTQNFIVHAGLHNGAAKPYASVLF